MIASAQFNNEVTAHRVLLDLTLTGPAVCGNLAIIL